MINTNNYENYYGAVDDNSKSSKVNKSQVGIEKTPNSTSR